MRATWYELEDGNVVDPAECAPDDSGSLVHKTGVKVAMRFPDCAMSREVDVGDNAASDASDQQGADKTTRRKRDTKEMKPDEQGQGGGAGYKTREDKAAE